MERSSAFSKTPCRLAVFPGLWPALRAPGAVIDAARPRGVRPWCYRAFVAVAGVTVAGVAVAREHYIGTSEPEPAADAPNGAGPEQQTVLADFVVDD